MDFKKLQDPQYLQEVAGNESLLKQAIMQTQGFVLEKLKKMAILPSLEMLMGQINAYTLPFIVDNYQLNAEQSEHVAQLLRNKESLDKHDSWTMEDYLSSETALPSGSILSLQHLRQFGSEEHPQEWRGGFAKIFEDSLALLDAHEILQLDKSFLQRHILEFPRRAELFENEELKYLYKELLLEQSMTARTRFEFLKTWPFVEKDRDWLAQILTELNGSRMISYHDACQLNGCTEIFSKEEYFARFNPYDTQAFTAQELLEQKSLVQEVWRQQMAQPETRFLVDLLDVNCSFELFVELFDRDYLQSLLQQHKGSSFICGYHGSQKDDTQKKHLYLLSACLDIISSWPASTTVDLHTLGEIVQVGIEDSSTADASYSKADNEKNARKIINEYFPLYFQTEEVGKLERLRFTTLNPGLLHLLPELFMQHAHVNSLYVACQLHQMFEKHTFIGHDSSQTCPQMEAIIERLVDKLQGHTAEIGLLVEHFVQNDKSGFFSKLKEKISQRPEKNLPAFQEDTYNFLAYDPSKLASLGEEKMLRIDTFTPALLRDILARGVQVGVGVLRHCLSNSDQSRYRDFLSQYAQLHRESIEKDTVLLALFMTNPHQEEIFPKKTTAQDEESFSHLLSLLEQQKAVNKKRSTLSALFYKLMPNDEDELPGNRQELEDFANEQGKVYERHVALKPDWENLQSWDAWDVAAQYVLLSEESENLAFQCKSLHNQLGFSIIKQKMLNLMREGSLEHLFNLVDAVKYMPNRSQYDSLLIEEIKQMPLDGLLAGLQHARFADFVLKFGNERRGNSLKFNFPSDEENAQVAYCLMKRLYAKGINLAENIGHQHLNVSAKLLSFFANHEFVIPFCIEHLPREVFSQPHLSMTSTYAPLDPTSLVKRLYTFEEILQAWNNLEKLGGILIEKDPDTDITKFFKTNLFSTPDGQLCTDLTRYVEFLDFAKLHNAKLYTLACHHMVFQHVGVEKSFQDKTICQEQFKHEVMAKHMDIDTIAEGLKGFLEDGRNMERWMLNQTMLQTVLNGIVYNCNYEIYQKGLPTQYGCLLAPQDSLKIFKLFYEHASLYLLEYDRVGSAKKVTQYLAKNVQHFTSPDLVKSFIFPHHHLRPVNFSLKTYRTSVLGDMVEKLITQATMDGQSQTVELLAHLVKQQRFVDKELAYHHRLNAQEEVVYDKQILHCLAKDDKIAQLLEKTTLHIKLQEELCQVPDENFYNKKKKAKL